MSTRSIGTFVAGALLASALTFTGMQAWQVTAAPGDTDTTFVPVPPCRLFDTRTGPDNVGTRSTPLGPDEVFITQVTGTNGECVGIPTSARAVAFNVTIVNPTAAGVLTLYPADVATTPKASNLNWVAGQPPTPNKVDVKLAPDGKVKVWNAHGTVDVLADVVGYYTSSSLSEMNNRLATLERRRPTIVPSGQVQWRQINATPTSVASVVVQSATGGTVLMHATGAAQEDTAGHNVACALRDSLVVPDFGGYAVWDWEASGATQGNTGGEGDISVMSLNHTYTLVADTPTTLHFVCVNRDGGTSRMYAPILTAIVHPN